MLGRISRSDTPRVVVSDGAKLRAVTDETAKLKLLLADTMLDSVELTDLLGKNRQRAIGSSTIASEHAKGCSASADAGSRRLATSIAHPRTCKHVLPPMGRQLRNNLPRGSSEITSQTILKWANDNSVKRHNIDPRKQQQKAVIESLNDSLRDELLNGKVFVSLGDSRRKLVP